MPLQAHAVTWSEVRDLWACLDLRCILALLEKGPPIKIRVKGGDRYRLTTSLLWMISNEPHPIMARWLAACDAKRDSYAVALTRLLLQQQRTYTSSLLVLVRPRKTRTRTRPVPERLPDLKTRGVDTVELSM